MSVEDVYEYDCPRPAVPPAPTRRTLSDISSPAAAFSTLSMDSAVEASMYLHHCLFEDHDDVKTAPSSVYFPVFNF